MYEEIDLDPPAGQTGEGFFKDLIVQTGPGPVLGLAGEQEGVRTWRTDYDGTGWRFFVDDGSAFWFRRDVWLEGEHGDVPCEQLGADEDVRSCMEASPTEENYYLPGRKRLDYRADRVCERSTWTETYRTWTIVIDPEDGECPLDDWRSASTACAATEIAEVTEQWSVVSIDQRIVVPAGVFEHCLCVRRRELGNPTDPKDATYCFAQGIGKVWELSVGENVECLAQYEMGDGRTGPRDGWQHDCDPDAID